ncbi:uncharacterized protein LOC124784833 [Schistocerca piceifrons]|uniref:uncharacterized protein LOC124784833 n=1 Tax=Schistocerca piceifrons TaxID=274613 RepID=UPI001F5F1E04|nr:uncharacterized protein LOC124784833 [Schistocerca piceifrons]
MRPHRHCDTSGATAETTMHLHSSRHLKVLAVVLLLLQVALQPGVEAHARLMDPPARNSMWRFGYLTPVNYNDNELYCGGFTVQWQQYNGSCGLCGDSFGEPKPRPHEAGGLYGKGVISRNYVTGQEIQVEVDLTANHYGYFEMFICPNNNPKFEVDEECLRRNPLIVAGTRNETRYFIPPGTKKSDTLRYKVRLPPFVTCTQCVIQWRYVTANNWGLCADGSEAVGCGPTETFVNCADVAIVTAIGGLPPSFVSSQDNPHLLYYRDFRTPGAVAPLVIRAQVCEPTPLYRSLPGMGEWCQTNCLRYPPNCPPELCHCPRTCDAIGELEGREGADEYCMDQCLVYPPRCPRERCFCY